LCHPLALSKVTLDITPDKKLPGCHVRATVKVKGPTGVEMEALTAVSVACLTIYDMVKAVERGIQIEGIRLVEKKGGKSGHYLADYSKERTMALMPVAEAYAASSRTLWPCRRKPSPSPRRIIARCRATSRRFAPSPRRHVGDGWLCRPRG
jgi:hypothetical protein